MPNPNPESTCLFAGRPVRRMGYGAMQLAGHGVFGPPRDPAAAVAVLRDAVAAGRAARLAGRITRRFVAEASSSFEGRIDSSGAADGRGGAGG